MSMTSDEGRRSERSGRGARKAGGETGRAGSRKRIAERGGQYLVAPTNLNVNEQALLERLGRLTEAEVVRTVVAETRIGPPIAVVRMTPRQVAALRRSAAGTLVVERDVPLVPAALLTADGRSSAPEVARALGPGFSTTVQVLSENDQPVEQAEVQIFGQTFAAQGITGKDGKVELGLYGELPETVRGLLIKPPADAWGLWKHNPNLQADAVNSVSLRTLPEPKTYGWGAQAMSFDRLPSAYRGAGAKIALIDTGMAQSHDRLGRIETGVDATRGDERAWSTDPIGHGTWCAGLIGAKSGDPEGFRGLAPDAELRMWKLPLDACCSDLIAALDGCAQAEVDVVCLGYGCEQASAIVEQRIIAVKQHGTAIVAPAGNTGHRVQFPACSMHVLAVGAIGRPGTFPEDSPHAAYEEEPTADRLFVPAFSCSGPEIDVCAPGLAIISCQSPDGYAACDGTSIAAAHVTALAGLVLAHHADFRHQFGARNATRVERLFQILKQTAQPLPNALRSGAGLPDALRALGLEAQLPGFTAPLDSRLADMRSAVRFAGLLTPGQYESSAPLRGPAVITNFPLNFIPPLNWNVAGAPGRLSDLKTAMQTAGLSP
jgi:subtilisin